MTKGNAAQTESSVPWRCVACDFSADLKLRMNTGPAKVQIALRLREETTLTIALVAERLNLGTAKNAKVWIHAASGKGREMLLFEPLLNDGL